jgi:hypothetical protein
MTKTARTFKTKAAVVAYLKKSFAEGAEVIQTKGDSGMMQVVVTPESHTTVPLVALAYGLLEHCGEHYGQLVGYYRAAGWCAAGIAAQQVTLYGASMGS